MHWLLIGYMFLFIHRPFELWPALGELHVERVYILGVMARLGRLAGQALASEPAALRLLRLRHRRRCSAGPCRRGPTRGRSSSRTGSRSSSSTSCWSRPRATRRRCKRLAAGFLLVMAVYMLHSLREFVGGRHTYRMGIVRMIGVDSSLGDPNSFGASIVFALPFVRAFWLACRQRWVRLALVSAISAFRSAASCLTGSRSSLLGLVVWGAMGDPPQPAPLAGASRPRRSPRPLLFLALPESLQTRFETIVNPEVGPENARVSGEGPAGRLDQGDGVVRRLPGDRASAPGSWRPATGSKLESHNLYGQLCGEMGLPGVLAFGAIVVVLRAEPARGCGERARRDPAGPDAFEHHLAARGRRCPCSCCCSWATSGTTCSGTTGSGSAGS